MAKFDNDELFESLRTEIEGATRHGRLLTYERTRDPCARWTRIRDDGVGRYVQVYIPEREPPVFPLLYGEFRGPHDWDARTLGYRAYVVELIGAFLVEWLPENDVENAYRKEFD